MELSSDTLYQIVRVLFAVSLLGFLFLVIRVTMKELQQPVVGGIRIRQPQQRAELVTVAGEDGSTVAEGLVFDIQGVATLGRAQSARIVLDDTSISAHHAMLRPVEGGWAIEDLGSRNGTLVNGRPVTSQLPIACGDAIQLGRVRLRLMC
jgi:pSer/pThr/pTyr-binding forkhead associated (FHA) protein